MDSLSSGDMLALATFVLAFSFFIIIALIIGYVITSILLSLMFKKAGESMWKAWVPFYNMWVMFELAGYQGWLSLVLVFAPSVLAPIPVIGTVASIAAVVMFVIVSLNLQKAYNKTWPYILWYIFLPIVWFAILALDSSTYDKTKLGAAMPEFLAKKD